MNPRRVLVLGAGFTHAFFPDAPLMVSDYHADSLLTYLRDGSYTSMLLRTALKKDEPGHPFDIEALMTRLDSGMPYDGVLDCEYENKHLLSLLKKAFIQRIQAARKNGPNLSLFGALAQYIVRNDVGIITFNYDDLLEEALHNVVAQQVGPGWRWWSPEKNYGFACAAPFDNDWREKHHSRDVITPILKLHGSMNWRLRLGSNRPCSLDSIVHVAQWADPEALGEPDFIETLERDPFIVPPVLSKKELGEEPLLRLLWTRAYDMLKLAKEIVFVGYSMPFTDIAARNLFSESLGFRNFNDVKVVDWVSENNTVLDRDRTEENLRSAYRQSLRWVQDEVFDFGGALNWAEQYIKDGL